MLALVRTMNYTVGQVVQGTVTGIQPYGAFVKVDGHTDGLIHISEISSHYVNDVHNYVNIGEKVVVKVIDIDEKNRQLRLSLKAVQPGRKSGRSHISRTEDELKIGFSSLKDKLIQWIEEEK